MLSIIISSYQPHYYSALQDSIANTCGIPYEIIKIDNPGLMGICEAYNRGAAKAIYNNLLFLHEDVLFETKDWGQRLIEFFDKKNTGCVGLAGSNYVPNVPHKWWKNNGYDYNNVLHFVNHKKTKSGQFTENLQKVYSLDGVFIACRKDVFNQVHFSKKLKSYHGYDIDFSIRVSETHQNYVISEIELLHFSGGNANKDWFKEMIKARNFYKIPKNQKNDKSIEVLQYDLFAENVYRYCDTKKEALKLLIRYFSIKKMGITNINRCLKFCYYILQK